MLRRTPAAARGGSRLVERDEQAVHALQRHRHGHERGRKLGELSHGALRRTEGTAAASRGERLEEPSCAAALCSTSSVSGGALEAPQGLAASGRARAGLRASCSPWALTMAAAWADAVPGAGGPAAAAATGAGAGVRSTLWQSCCEWAPTRAMNSARSRQAPDVSESGSGGAAGRSRRRRFGGSSLRPAWPLHAYFLGAPERLPRLQRPSSSESQAHSELVKPRCRRVAVELPACLLPLFLPAQGLPAACLSACPTPCAGWRRSAGRRRSARFMRRSPSSMPN